MDTSGFPRTPKSKTVVHQADWSTEVPYGHCPACGSTGMEELPSPGAPYASFFCSDESCLTVMRTGEKPVRTKWEFQKPREVLLREGRSGSFWNPEHFPGQEIPLACPT